MPQTLFGRMADRASRVLRPGSFPAFLVAIAMVTLTTEVRLAANDIVPLTDQLALLLTVILTAFLTGWWPSVAAAVLATLSYWHLFLPKRYAFHLEAPGHFTSLILFFIATLLIVMIIEALRQSNQRAAQLSAVRTELFEQNPAAILLTAADGRIVEANKVASDLFRVPHGDLIGRSVTDLLPERSGEGHDAPRSDFLASPMPRQMGAGLDIMARRGDGTEFPADVQRGAIVLDGRQCAIATVSDLTESRAMAQTLEEARRRQTILEERAQAADELRLSEERLRLFIEHAPAAIAMFDRDMRYLAVSKRFLTEYEITEPVLGRSHYDVFPHLPERWRALHRRVLAGEVLTAQDDRFERADGTVRWSNWELRPWIGRDGAIGGIVLFDEDVTERHHAAAELRVLTDACMNAAIGISIIDPHTMSIRWANHAWARARGYRTEEAIGLGRDECMAPGEPTQLMRIYETAADGDRFSVDADLLRKDGSVFPGRLDIVVIRGGPGGANYLVVSSRDLTEERITAATLLQAQKAESIGAVTGGMAHDFNNILGIITLNLGLARSQMTETDPSRPMVQDAIDAARRGAELVRSLLAFARRQPLRPQRLVVNDLVRGTSNMLARLLGDDIVVEARLHEGLWPTVVDPSQLDSSLMNLATNARDAMPRGGNLLIATANQTVTSGAMGVNGVAVPEGDYVSITVSDTGVGMTKDVQANAFEPFFTTKPTGKGTGLGLSSVLGFVRQSGGHVMVTTEIGRGTSIRLLLPRAPEQDSTARSAQPVIANPLIMGKNELILVVEDNAVLRLAADAQLRALGYRVVTAADANEALEVAGRRPVDLVFTDIVMPGGMSGHELSAEVQNRWPSTPILMTSGFGHDLTHTDESLRRLHVLRKPYDRETLARSVRAALDERIA